MDESYVLSVTSQCLYLILTLAAPILISVLTVGLCVSILQATTQVQEQTLSFVPKIVAAFVSIAVCGTWMASMIANYAISIITNIPNLSPR
ncbi:MAG: flagellar biosynthesis protein FliQ [Candidatus Eremiobacteraeota bacterium]|nr:flagellar biosynthesis protein FliQ [Candidatus Eremiobacteraeota bacterium]